MTSTPRDDKTAPRNDAFAKALEGTDSGSDTRAGSLRGGSASGSDIDPDTDIINEALAQAGRRLHAAGHRPDGGPPEAESRDAEAGDDADAATG